MILDMAVRAALMPLLLAQAVYLRMTFVHVPEPSGPHSGVIGAGPKVRLLILGDSSAVGVGVQAQDDALLGQISERLAKVATVEFRLIARTGAKTGEVLGWLDDKPTEAYGVIVVALGVNDVTKAVSLRKWLGQQSALLDRLVQDFGAKHVFVSGLPPMRDFPSLPQPMRWVLGRQAERFNRALHALVALRDDSSVIAFDLRLDESNMSSDGFHPGPEVYAAWAEAAAAQIMAQPGLLDGQGSSA
jgi:lysophospholipase L1-like esterase